MSASTANNLQVASVTDRGLSDKRPLNEDSFLADAARGIFAVADGVGGAEAGEVASQTAVEVLDEAFRHRVSDGEDVEDLMELAIQRANSSIHQMAAEHPRFSMMATTIVSLHIEGNRATIGHVGDSRLYRISPDGGLHRETRDHSVVEEEVRAGRMTPEQAVNHPSKNVISRALGAEETVEVDLKTMEVPNGSCFLLCSDGITRHITDNELRGLFFENDDLPLVCAELKRRCYERGAVRSFARFFIFLLFIAGVGAAFYGGTRYKGSLPFGLSTPAVVPPVSQPRPSPEDPLLGFERSRREIDEAPAAWLANKLPTEL